jgi:hypothetical protein
MMQKTMVFARHARDPIDVSCFSIMLHMLLSSLQYQFSTAEYESAAPVFKKPMLYTSEGRDAVEALERAFVPTSQRPKNTKMSVNQVIH